MEFARLMKSVTNKKPKVNVTANTKPKMKVTANTKPKMNVTTNTTPTKEKRKSKSTSGRDPADTKYRAKYSNHAGRKDFNSRKLVSRHQEDVHSAKEILGKFKGELQQLKELKHTLTHVSVDTRRCLICKAVVQNGNLARHMVIHEPARRTFTCETCKNSFSRRDSLKRHAVIHSLGRHRACAKCGFVCSRSDELLSRMRKAHGQSTSPLLHDFR